MSARALTKKTVEEIVKILKKSNALPINQSKESVEAFARMFAKTDILDANTGAPLRVFHGTASPISGPPGAEDAPRLIGGKYDSLGYHLTPYNDTANHFAGLPRHNQKTGQKEVASPQVLSGYVDIRNPLRLEDTGQWSAFENVLPQIKEKYPGISIGHKESIPEALERQGHTGIVYLNRFEGTGGESILDEYQRAVPGSDWAQASEAIRGMTDAEVRGFFGHKVGDSYIAFRPEQFKSQFNSGAWNPAEQNYLKSILPLIAAAGVGSAVLAPEDANAMFIGKKGLVNLLGAKAAGAKLGKAGRMSVEGLSNEEIRQATDLFKGMDGKWRYELDDSGLKIHDYWRTPAEVLSDLRRDALIGDDDVLRRYAKAVEPFKDMTPEDVAKRWQSVGQEAIQHTGDKDKLREVLARRDGEDLLLTLMGQRDFGPLNRYVSHDLLEKAYPGITEMHTRQGPSVVDDLAGAAGSYQRPQPGVSGESIWLEDLNPHSLHKKDNTDTLLHELQHAVQNREGFARGGSVKEFSATQTLANVRIRFLNEELSRAAKAMDAAPKGSPEWSRARESYDAAMREKLETWVPVAQRDPHEQYRNLAGEIEARDTGSRAGLGVQERKDTPPNLPKDAEARFHGALPLSAGGAGAGALALAGVPNAEAAQNILDPFRRFRNAYAGAEDAPLEAPTIDPVWMMTAPVGVPGFAAKAAAMALDPAIGYGTEAAAAAAPYTFDAMMRANPITNAGAATYDALRGVLPWFFGGR